MNKLAFMALTLAATSGAAWAAKGVTEPPMVSIPGGSFLMGNSAATPSPPQPLEQPVHEVRIAPFQLAKYEVTVGQYREFIKASGHKTNPKCWRFASNEWGIEVADGSWSSPPYQQDDTYPVLCVSWEDAKAYTAWLSAQTGKPYALPSEAQWEYAARAGSADKYHFGADETQVCRYGNVRDMLGREALGKITGKPGREAVCSDGSAFTSIVGMYAPNAFGLYDMIGNVGEIVEDCEHPNYEGAPTDGSAWSTGCKNDMRIHRGGNFASRGGAASTARGHTGHNNASVMEGFRVALNVAGPVKTSAVTKALEATLEAARVAERSRRALRK